MFDNPAMQIKGNIVDIYKQQIFAGEITVEAGRITAIRPIDETVEGFILPGFIDAHVHIESSMLVPSAFARLAVVHGTVATVSDPHEIANVCGMDGVEFMINNGRTVNFKFNFGAPSCVPATTFETAGAAINSTDIEQLMRRNEIKYLSEMMNFPGVIFNDAQVMEKIAIAHRNKKPVDGHAPGLRGEPLKKYVSAGISTDHECFTKEEALEKIKLGMKVLIREGSAAKNFEALIDLLREYPDQIMFCSDDKHPDSLVQSHINALCARAVAKNIDVFHVLKAACITPVTHYKLEVGTLRPGDAADFIVVNNLREFQVLHTFINGQCVASNGQSFIERGDVTPINHFCCEKIDEAALALNIDTYRVDGLLPVIEALDGQLITNKLMLETLDEETAKIVVVNRYRQAPPAIAFIKGFGIQRGAIASTVAHDSHNIIAVGKDDASISKAINELIDAKGGICCVTEDEAAVLPLPVAGLMSAGDGYEVATAYSRLDALAKKLGTPLSSPFMTLSFMALLVIPALKLSDRGLFDGQQFRFVHALPTK